MAIAVPWLNPLAGGPTPSVVSWLISLGSVGCLLLAGASRTLHGGQSFSALGVKENWVAPVAIAWTAAGLLSCVIGLMQYFDVAAGFAPWVSQASFGEAYGNLRQRNQFATLVNIALACLIWLAFRHDFSYWNRFAVLGGAALLATGNAISSSRGGLAQYLLLYVACGVWGVWRTPLIRHLMLAAALAYVLAVFALPLAAGVDPTIHGMLARVRDGAPCTSRITLWSNVIHLIGQKPWLGWGWGELDYAHYLTRYDGLRFCELLDNAHNLPLHLAVELGIPAALLLCGAFTGWVVLQQPWTEKDAARQLAWSVLMVILLHSLVEYPLWYGPFQIAAGLCILFLGVRSHGNFPRHTGMHGGHRLRRMALVAVAMVVLSATIYAAWDYRRVSQIYLPPFQRIPAYRENTLEKIQGSWLFAEQVNFAELSVTPLNRENAEWNFRTSNALLHFSPEPKVIERLIESAAMLGRDKDAVAHLARYRAAYPKEYEQWAKAKATTFPLLFTDR